MLNINYDRMLIFSCVGWESLIYYYLWTAICKWDIFIGFSLSFTFGINDKDASQIKSIHWTNRYTREERHFSCVDKC